jgi:DNA-binding NtrC family response regulator
MRHLTGRRALLIDDDAAICRLTAKLLGYFQVDVTPATTVAEAFSHATAAEFDVIVCDRSVKSVDALSFLPQVLGLQPTAGLVVTSGALERVALAELGRSYEFLIKPFSSIELSAKIADAVARRPRLSTPQSA